MATVVKEDDQPQASERRLPRGFNKEAYDLVEVIESYGVDLMSTGNELKALCPFHSEKTPSFSVNPDKQVYYCHGCHVGGMVVDFVAAQESITRYDAALRLMGDAGTHRYDADVLRRKLTKVPAGESFDSDKYRRAIYDLEKEMLFMRREKQYFDEALWAMVKRLRRRLSASELFELWDKSLELFGVERYHRLIVWELTWETFWMGEGSIDRRAGRLTWRSRNGEHVLRSEWDALYIEVRDKARYLAEGTRV